MDKYLANPPPFKYSITMHYAQGRRDDCVEYIQQRFEGNMFISHEVSSEGRPHLHAYAETCKKFEEKERNYFSDKKALGYKMLNRPEVKRPYSVTFVKSEVKWQDYSLKDGNILYSRGLDMDALRQRASQVTEDIRRNTRRNISFEERLCNWYESKDPRPTTPEDIIRQMYYDRILPPAQVCVRHMINGCNYLLMKYANTSTTTYNERFVTHVIEEYYRL